jgi:GNAT superfamily N-acetyltransferase
MGPEGDLVETRLARGCLCYAVLIDDAVAGYGWLSRGPEWIGEAQLEIKPREGEAYIWNCVTLPPHRLHGVFTSLVFGISQAARRLGARRVWIGGADVPAARVFEALGFRPAIRASSVSFAGINLARATGGADRQLAQEGANVLGVRLGLKLRASLPKRRH